MFTSIDKAIVALVMALAFIGTALGFNVPEWLTEEWVAGVIALATPAVVYWWPNKKNDSAKGKKLPPATGIVMLTLLPVMLVGCAALPSYKNVEDTRDAILIVTTEARGANLLLQQLIRAGTISDADARDALSQLREISRGLREANSAIDLSGDPIKANSELDAAKRTTRLLLRLLSQYVNTATIGELHNVESETCIRGPDSGRIALCVG